MQFHSHPYNEHSSYPGYNPNQGYSIDYYQNPMLVYGDHSPAEQYFHDHNSPGMYSDLVREYGFDNNYNYNDQYHPSYQQYSNYPNVIHDYL